MNEVAGCCAVTRSRQVLFRFFFIPFHQFYAEHRSKPFFASLIKAVTSGPIVCMVWEGHDVVAQGRKMMGATNPQKAETGTLRGDYSQDVGRNLMHGSDSVQAATKEIKIWFNDDEIVNWSRPGLDCCVYESK